MAKGRAKTTVPEFMPDENTEGLRASEGYQRVDGRKRRRGSIDRPERLGLRVQTKHRRVLDRIADAYNLTVVDIVEEALEDIGAKYGFPTNEGEG